MTSLCTTIESSMKHLPTQSKSSQSAGCGLKLLRVGTNPRYQITLYSMAYFTVTMSRTNGTSCERSSTMRQTTGFVKQTFYLKINHNADLLVYDSFINIPLRGRILLEMYFFDWKRFFRAFQTAVWHVYLVKIHKLNPRWK